MATTTLWPDIRTRLLRELDLGMLIPNAAFDSAATGSITSADMLRDTNIAGNHFSSKATVIHRPAAATAADFIRFAGALTNTTGLLAHTGANYADTTVTSETVELWYDRIRPDKEIKDAANRALEFCFFSTFVPISHGGDLDFDMAATTDTNWTDVLTPTTSAKSVTARRVPYGLRAYNLIADAVGEGTRSATIGVSQGRPIRSWAIVSCDSGGMTYQPYDITNSAVMTSPAAVTHTEEEPQLVEWHGNVPATCKEAALNFISTANPSSFFINMAWLYKTDNLRVNLPGYVSEQFKAPSVFMGIPIQQNGTGYYDAQSLDMVELTEGKDYRYLTHQPDANPHAILVLPGSRAWGYPHPLFVQARRPYSDLTTFSVETDSTTCPLHLLMPAFKMRVLLDILIPRQPGSPVWAAKYAEARQEWDAANQARPVVSAAPQPRFGKVARL